jgi:Flp pilus assembly pilin Flp
VWPFRTLGDSTCVTGQPVTLAWDKGERAVGTIKSLTSRFVDGEEGVGLIEYGLLAALIAMACVVTMGLVGEHLNTKYKTFDEAID